MSGGGGYSTGGGPGVSCELAFQTVLVGPDSSVLVVLRKGDTLFIELGTDQRTLHAVTATQQFAGAVVEKAENLRRCIRDGYEYIAFILEIDGASCRVEVRNA
jgi:hypothetical protein